MCQGNLITSYRRSGELLPGAHLHGLQLSRLSNCNIDSLEVLPSRGARDNSSSDLDIVRPSRLSVTQSKHHHNVKC